VQIASSAPDDQLTAQSEDTARAQAGALYAKSVESYTGMCLSGASGNSSSISSLGPEAAVNCANTLSAWAELLTAFLTPSAAQPLLPTAQAAVNCLHNQLGLPPWSSVDGVNGAALAASRDASQWIAAAQAASSTTGVPALEVHHSAGLLLDACCGLYAAALRAVSWCAAD
jgi:hypothetical protein